MAEAVAVGTCVTVAVEVAHVLVTAGWSTVVVVVLVSVTVTSSIAAVVVLVVTRLVHATGKGWSEHCRAEDVDTVRRIAAESTA